MQARCARRSFVSLAVIVLVGVFPIRKTAGQVFERVSVANGGVEGDAASEFADATGDGRFVTFFTFAANFFPGDVPVTFGQGTGYTDVFVRDRVAGTLTLVSVATDGVSLANSFSFNPVISDNGRFVAFESFATNITAAPVVGFGDMYMRDLNTGTTQWISVALGGGPGDGPSGPQVRPSAISADGSLLAFESQATNLTADADTNSVFDLFLRDTVAGTTTLVSRAAGGGAGSGQSIAPAMSPDGRYVAFVSDAADLVANDTNGVPDVFVYDTLNATLTLISRHTNGTLADAGSFRPAVSNTGIVTFGSPATNLVDVDANGPVADMFLHDLNTGATTLVAPGGIQGNADSGDRGKPAITPDGRFIAFETLASIWSAADTNAARDVYVYDSLNDTMTLASMNTSCIVGDLESRIPSLRDDGRMVFFHGASTNFVPDANTANDVFASAVVVRGDINGDSAVNPSDTAGFVAVLLGQDADPVRSVAADLNCDGAADGGDIASFVAALLAP